MYIAIELTVSLMFTLISYRYLKNEYSKVSPNTLAALAIYSMAMFLLLGTFIVLENTMATDHSIINILKIITLFSMLFTIAWTDYQECRIPNEVLLFCVSIRLIYLLFELMLDKDACLKMLQSTLLLFGITAIIFLIITLITKNALGMGDVKMILTLCLYLKYIDLINTVFYSLLVSCIISIYFVTTKKKTRKDSIPLAPSFLIGISLYFLVNINII